MRLPQQHFPPDKQHAAISDIRHNTSASADPSHYLRAIVATFDQREIAVALLHVNGIDINYEVAGTGPSLLLIHGLGASLESLREDIAVFSKDFRVIAYDARGHGKSSRSAEFSLQDHIEDAREIVSAVSQGPVAVIGTSMGSYIAQGLAAQYHDLVERAVFVVPKSNGASSSTARLLQEFADEVRDMSSMEKQKFVLRRAFAPNTSDDVRETTIARELILPLGAEEFAAASSALAGFDFRPILPSVKARTLVMTGRHDSINPPAEGRVCAALVPYSIHFEFWNSGHFPSAEEPGWYYAVTRKFLGVQSDSAL